MGIAEEGLALVETHGNSGSSNISRKGVGARPTTTGLEFQNNKGNDYVQFLIPCHQVESGTKVRNYEAIPRSMVGVSLSLRAAPTKTMDMLTI